MSYTCHHGTMIHFCWDECPECVEEHIAREEADNVAAALEEQRKQTALMEQILKNQQELLKNKR